MVDRRGISRVNGIDVLGRDHAPYALLLVADLAPAPPAPARVWTDRLPVATVWRLSVAGIVLSLSALVLVAAPSDARPAQDPASVSTTAPTPTLEPVAVPDPTAAPETPAPAVGADGRPANNAAQVSAENRRIWLVVGGLVFVAIALLLLTIRYWRQTKPVAVTRSSLEEPDAAELETSDEDAGGRHSRRAVAGADHSSADDTWEPRGTGEHDRIEKPTGASLARPSADQRQAAYEAQRNG